MQPKKYITLTIIVFISKLALSQFSVVKYPVRFSQYYNCYPLVNPAALGTHNQYEASLGNQSLLGIYSKIATSYLNTGMQLNKRNRRDRPYSAIGLLLINDREGKYLNRNRYYANYAWHAKISRDFWFSGGFQIGGMSYSVKGTELTGSGSDIAPDGAIGLQVYNKTFHLGASYQQIFNSKIQPLEEVAYLSSYVNISGSYRFLLLDRTVFDLHSSTRFQPDDKRYFVDLNASVELIKKISTGIGVHNSNMMILDVGLRNLAISTGNFSLNLSYGFSAGNSIEDRKFIELGLRFLSIE